MDCVVVSCNNENSSKIINKHIYGHFSEHLGRCIYGGFWVGKNSDIPNIDGYRKDVVEAFKEINIPNLRWPGGCFADEYHWKDGIGPYETRKRMINTHWGGVVEDNSFGTHEFMGLCKVLGCEPYVNGNVGSGTVQEMSEWVEYMTFDGESPMSKLRAQNGHPDPYKLTFFGVGNENWGCGGNMRPEYYADEYRRYQTYVRQYGKNKIFKIACGANGNDYEWTDVVMKNASKFMDGLSLHYYTVEPNWDSRTPAADFDEHRWYLCLSKASYMEELVTRHGQIMDKYDPEKKIALIVDEWGTWHAVEKDTNPGFLYQQNTVRDALVAGITLNIFNNHCDRVRMANIAQAVNVLQSPVLTEGNKLIKTPTWHVFNMYKAHMDAQYLDSKVSSNIVGEKDCSLCAISSSASVKDGVYTVTLTNASLDEDKTVCIDLQGFKGSIKNASAVVLQGKKMNSMNTFDKPDEVTEKPCDVKIEGKTLQVTLPCRSVMAVTIK